MMRKFGLIGYPLSHSFSQRFFTEKFEKEKIRDAEYQLYPLESIRDFDRLCQNEPDLVGINVTIPYKESILNYLAEIETTAKEIGAVNVLKRLPSGGWKGYNSDYYGFESTLLSVKQKKFWAGKSALVFGSGGSAKAVKKVLERLGIRFNSVSRSGQEPGLRYDSLRAEHVQQVDVLINCTPVGMYPKTGAEIAIPYEAITNSQLVIDLIYNPERTRFLEKAELQGAQIINGSFMLVNQAEKAWEIWNTDM